MNNLGFVKLYVLWMPPEHGQDKIVYWWNRLVYVFEVHVQEILQNHINQFSNPMYLYNHIKCVDLVLPVQQKVWEGQL